MKKIAVVVLLMCCYAVTNAQAQQAPSHKTIKGFGCVENAVETSCHVLVDSKTGDTYNLLFGAKAPKAGTAIKFTATEHQGMTTCMQGKAVNVTKWKKEKGIKCPPPAANPDTMH